MEFNRADDRFEPDQVISIVAAKAGRQVEAVVGIGGLLARNLKTGTSGVPRHLPSEIELHFTSVEDWH